MSASPPEVRSARSFLRQNLKAGTSDVPPRKYANAAKELGMSFSDLASLIARMYAGGQNESFYREQAIERDVARGGQN